MNFGKALAIFMQIDSNKYSDIEKALAIYKVMNAPTHMAIKKDDMLKVIRYLWDNLYEIQVKEALPEANKNSLPETTRQTVLESFMKGSEN